MAERCPRCGAATRAGEPPRCPVCGWQPGASAPAPAAPGSLAVPALGPRLAAGLVDLALLALLDGAAAVLDGITLDLAGVAAGLACAALVLLRDLDGGRYSPGKRLFGLVVVDAASGRKPAAGRALARNAPLAAGWLFAALPDPFGWLGWIVLALLGALGTAMIAGEPSRRRLGDLLAETAVRRRLRGS